MKEASNCGGLIYLSQLRLNVEATWALEGKQFEPRLVRLDAEQPHPSAAFRAARAHDGIGVRSCWLVGRHGPLITAS